jgi:hypothetical protein
MTPNWLFPVLLCLILIMPASALTITAEGVSSYSVVPETGYVIYQITVNDLPIGTNQTHTLVSGSGTYLLTIGTYDEWGYKNADITLTLPNGSVQTAHASALGILINGYKTHIQYVYPQAYSASGLLSVDLVLGLTPASASFNAGAMGWNPSNSLAFTAASGNVGGSTTIYVEQMKADDFKKHVTNYDPLYGIGNLGGQVFQWSWSAVLGFVSMIPVIGPVMVNLINTMGGIIQTGFYWLNFTVSNFPAILCGVECLILMMAVINAPGKNSFKKLASNIYRYNVAFVVGIISLVSLVWTWTKGAVEMIAAVVGALKPI